MTCKFIRSVNVGGALYADVRRASMSTYRLQRGTRIKEGNAKPQRGSNEGKAERFARIRTRTKKRARAHARTGGQGKNKESTDGLRYMSTEARRTAKSPDVYLARNFLHEF